MATEGHLLDKLAVVITTVRDDDICKSHQNRPSYLSCDAYVGKERPINYYIRTYIT